MKGKTALILIIILLIVWVIYIAILIQPHLAPRPPVFIEPRDGYRPVLAALNLHGEFRFGA